MSASVSVAAFVNLCRRANDIKKPRGVSRAENGKKLFVSEGYDKLAENFYVSFAFDSGKFCSAVFRSEERRVG